MTGPSNFLALLTLYVIVSDIWSRISQKEKRKTWPSIYRVSMNIGTVVCVLVLIWYAVVTVLEWLQK